MRMILCYCALMLVFVTVADARVPDNVGFDKSAVVRSHDSCEKHMSHVRHAIKWVRENEAKILMMYSLSFPSSYGPATKGQHYAHEMEDTLRQIKWHLHTLQEVTEMCMRFGSKSFN